MMRLASAACILRRCGIPIVPLSRSFIAPFEPSSELQLDIGQTAYFIAHCAQTEQGAAPSMAIPATQLRPGMIIKHNDQLHLVFKVEHRTPGNLRAFIQAKLRNLKSGAMFEHRFRSADAIEKVVVDEVPMEFLYADGDDYYFMNPVDYEQTVLKSSTLGDAVEYLTANLQINVSYFDGQPVGIELPQTVDSSRRNRAGTEVGNRIERHQARQDRNRPGGPGAALHQRGRKDPRRHQRRRIHEPRVDSPRTLIWRVPCRFPQSSPPPPKTIASTPTFSPKWSGSFARGVAAAAQRQFKSHCVDRGPRHLDAEGRAFPAGNRVVAALAQLVRARNQVQRRSSLPFAAYV